MITPEELHVLADQSLAGGRMTKDQALAILTDTSVPLLPLLQAAYQVRHTYWQNTVSIHILNNAKNGHCPEDCGYCAQAKTSKAGIESYPIKSEAEILEEARQAYEGGAYRYCMVFSGRGPSKKNVEKLSGLIRKIKETYPIQVCLSPGLVDDDDAKALKEAGLDRFNHNLNSSESFYPSICSTHTYQDRLNTLQSVKKAGISMCSGMIVGLGETPQDVVDVLVTLGELESPSIPINFYMPIEGTDLEVKADPFEALTPDYCLRVLCLARFLNPKAEIRAAAGREMHLRSMQVMALYPANSIFMEGYLNTKGNTAAQTLQMIKDAGFTVKTDFSLDALLNQANYNAKDGVELKGKSELRKAAV